METSRKTDENEAPSNSSNRSPALSLRQPCRTGPYACESRGKPRIYGAEDLLLRIVLIKGRAIGLLAMKADDNNLTMSTSRKL
jgi:hypothetical protein